MIQYLKIKNFLSFRDEVTFSFEATNDKRMEETHTINAPFGIKLNKISVIYGANASGKSNLVNAFEFLRTFWLNIAASKDEMTGAIPFLLDNDSNEQPSFFELAFFIDTFRYVYTLEVDQQKVLAESLKKYSSIRPSEVFTRTYKNKTSEINFNAKVKLTDLGVQEITLKCLPNISIFAAYNQVNVHITEMDDVINWIKKRYLQFISPTTRLTEFAKRQILKNNLEKTFILSFLKNADFNIEDIVIQFIDKKLESNFVDDILKDKALPQDVKEKLEKDHTIQVSQASFLHRVIKDEEEASYLELPENLQSQGTLRTLGIAAVINLLLQLDAFVTIDEIETSLHPKLIEYIIEFFIQHSKKAQMLLTTHYDGLLEEDDLLRTDSIWFTNKLQNGATEVYSLSQFKGVNRISSLQKAYKYGKFKAIPNI